MTVKLNGSPLFNGRYKVTGYINDLYNRKASDNLHRDIAHADKRLEAQRVLDGNETSAEFAEEAEDMGITSSELAEIVLSKPNESAQRELERRKLLIRVASASAEELALITLEVNGSPG